MRSRSKVVVAFTIVAGAIFPSAAQAAAPAAADRAADRVHGAHAVPQEVAGPISAAVAEVVGADARPTVDGGFNVYVGDGVTHTHGPDPKRSNGRRFVANTSATPVAAGHERNPVCATDYYQHFLYGRQAGDTDNSATAIPAIRSIVKQLNQLLYESALDSSGNTVTADLKVKCDGGGNILVSTFTSPANDFNSIANAAFNAGFNATNVDYSIFYDEPATVACGVGSLYRDERDIVGNLSNNPGTVQQGYAVTYGGPAVFGTFNDCWETTTALHEAGHNQGAVQGLDPAATTNPDGSARVGSPNSTGDGGHCNDGLDVMCYDDGGSAANYDDTVCAEEMWDCGYNDYFDALVEGGEYLENHWNIGDPLNRFIEFGTLDALVRVPASVIVNESAPNAVVTVERTGQLATTFDVDFDTGLGTAEAEDFTDVHQTLSFAAGETTKTINVPIVNDLLAEPTETITLTLSNVANASDTVNISPTARIVAIRTSDQQGDSWIKKAGGSWLGQNIYNTTGSRQSVGTSARRGQSRTFYVLIQNDGTNTNYFRFKGVNTSGTSIAYYYGRTNVTRYVRSSLGWSVKLGAGRYRYLRVVFKMGSAASGTEFFKMYGTWRGDRVIHDVVRANVRVV